MRVGSVSDLRRIPLGFMMGLERAFHSDSPRGKQGQPSKGPLARGHTGQRWESGSPDHHIKNIKNTAYFLAMKILNWKHKT